MAHMVTDRHSHGYLAGARRRKRKTQRSSTKPYQLTIGSRCPQREFGWFEDFSVTLDIKEAPDLGQGLLA